jgi:hypothetical protein
MLYLNAECIILCVILMSTVVLCLNAECIILCAIIVSVT